LLDSLLQEILELKLEGRWAGGLGIKGE